MQASEEEMRQARDLPHLHTLIHLESHTRQDRVRLPSRRKHTPRVSHLQTHASCVPDAHKSGTQTPGRRPRDADSDHPPCRDGPACGPGGAYSCFSQSFTAGMHPGRLIAGVREETSRAKECRMQARTLSRYFLQAIACLWTDGLRRGDCHGGWSRTCTWA